MNITIPPLVRWVALAPCSLLAAAVIQYLVLFASLAILEFTFGTEPSWVSWLAKSLTSPFMGAAFVVVAWWVAPTHKNFAALTSLAVVALWASTLMIGSFTDNSAWVFVMGFLGLLGGTGAYYYGQSRSTVHGAV